MRTTVDGRELTVSNLDKVLYPATGFTKGQVIDYYARVADGDAAPRGDRPLTMKRYPNGVDHKFFFEKHMPDHAPSWVRHQAVPSTSEGDTGRLSGGRATAPPWCGRPIWLPSSSTSRCGMWGEGGSCRPHPTTWCSTSIPARGPPSSSAAGSPPSWPTSSTRAGPGCWPKTSGSKGLQLYVPLTGRPTWEKIRDRAHGIATRLEQDHPDLVVSNMRKSLRPGKVLIDWSQNHPAKTTVAVYSLRGREEPTVSTPVTWDEVDACARSGDPTDLRFTSDARAPADRGPWRSVRRRCDGPVHTPLSLTIGARMLGGSVRIEMGRGPRRKLMSAMGERLLILEETADALDVIDPELAVQFRLVNGLPRDPSKELPSGLRSAQLRSAHPESSVGPLGHHEMRMDVGEYQIGAECSCGEWACAFDWDEIDEMVVRIRGHVGSMPASTGDGIPAVGSETPPAAVEKWAG